MSVSFHMCRNGNWTNCVVFISFLLRFYFTSHARTARRAETDIKLSVNKNRLSYMRFTSDVRTTSREFVHRTHSPIHHVWPVVANAASSLHGGLIIATLGLRIACTCKPLLRIFKDLCVMSDADWRRNDAFRRDSIEIDIRMYVHESRDGVLRNGGRISLWKINHLT